MSGTPRGAKQYATVGELLADTVSDELLRDWFRELWENRQALREELRISREKISLLHDATVVLRNGMGRHKHSDCPICKREQEEVLTEATRLLNEVDRLSRNEYHV